MSHSSPDPDAQLLKQARVRVRTIDGRHHIRLTAFAPFMTFVAALAVGAVVCGFAYPIAAMLFNPNPVPMPLIVITIAAATCLAAYLGLRALGRERAGFNDLVIDDLGSLVSLPRSFGREEIIDVPFECIRDIAPAEELPKHADMLDADAFGVKRYRKGRVRTDDEMPRVGHRSEMIFAVVIEWRSERTGEVTLSPIIRWADRRRTNAFAHWLRRRLRVRVDALPEVGGP